MIRKGFLFWMIGCLLVIGALAAGGTLVYRAGMAQGLAQAPAMAEAMSHAASTGGIPVFPQAGPVWGFGYPPYLGWHHGFGFFPFGGFLGAILFFFLMIGILRMLYFRPWTWRHTGPWARVHGHPWGSPPWMKPDAASREGDVGKGEKSS